ncbi:uncharacterized protein LOC143906408 isoform X1 [Temnothorax americanus]|uniref:uncharacterized protein LOC143906408 isoform X1 n=1 Tax=Temnothorax americanus TaxID=1964332 RepID=UPI004068F4AB
MEHELLEQELKEQSERLNSIEDFAAWEQRCVEFIKVLEEQGRNKRPRLSIDNQHRQPTSLAAQIARLEGLKDSVRRRFVHVGAGYSASETGLRWREIDMAFKSRILTGAVINTDHIEPRKFLEDARNIVLNHVWNVIQQHDSVKIYTIFNGEFVVGDIRANKSIYSRSYELLRESDLEEWYELRVIEPTLASLEEFQERDSGWALSRIHNLMLNINKYNPLRTGCYIDLPQEIKLKKAVINIQSTDNACFAWSVIAALYPVKQNTCRIASYPPYKRKLNLEGIEFPMSLSQIKKFEDLNGISINVYAIKKNKDQHTILPIQLTDRKINNKHVNLLYVEDPRDANVGHFTWIKNLSRLVSSQINKNAHKKYFCDR